MPLAVDDFERELLLFDNRLVVGLVEFKRVFLRGLMFLMMTLGIAIFGGVYATSIASKGSSIAGMDSFDFAHVITESVSRLLVS